MAQLKTKFLLFGRTGSGKSTLANMLIKGNLNHPLLFGTSSGIRGGTLDMQRVESESRIVVDTVGFGEDEGGSVSDEEARNRLYNFFVKLSEGYHYFVYVHKWGKTDYLDTNLWSFFKAAFQDAEDNLLVVFTHSKPGYIEQHQEDLRSTFDCRDRYVSVDFPPDSPHPKASKVKINNLLRVESFKRLESALINFMRPCVLPWVVQNMRKGRIFLLGPCASSKDMITKMLVSGVLEPPNLSSTEVEGPRQVDLLCNTALDGGGLGYTEVLDATSVETSSTKVEGRGWQVVNLDWRYFSTGWQAVDLRRCRRVVFVTGYTCELSVNEIRKLQSYFANKVGAVIIDTRAGRQQEIGEAKDVLKPFKHCAFALHLRFPAFDVLEEVERQNIQTRKNSFKRLEDTLGTNFWETFSAEGWAEGFVWAGQNRFARLATQWRRLRSRKDDTMKEALDFTALMMNTDALGCTGQIVETNVPFAYLELKCRREAPRMLDVVIKVQGSEGCSWELQLVDIYGKEKEVPRHRCHPFISEQMCRGGVSDRAFLDNIELGDTIIVWVIPYENARITLMGGGCSCIHYS